ncbi:MAG: hypothetical protein ACRDTN_18330 [Mycobacterium sp.]
MLLRLELQPPWVRFLVSAVLVVFAGVGTSLTLRSPSESIRSTVAFAVVLGVVLAAAYTYTTRGRHTAFVEAVAGLDQAERSQAIAAVARGVVPADQRVRSSAVRLGRAYLGGKSPDQLKRKQRQRWVALAILVAIGIAAAVVGAWLAGLYLLAAVLLVVVDVRLGVLRTRRIQRNISLLTEGAGAQ